MADDLAAISAGQGPLIGHYRLLRTIGQGSFGKVWLGRHLPTGTEVAVKAIPRQGVSTPQSRLLREVDCMAVLRHPHIVQLFEVIKTRNSLFLVMEHVSGGDLWDHLDARGALTETEARRIFLQLLSAVHYCHQRGIVHRDLKPTNVLLDADSNVKLTDFGLGAPFRRTTLSTFCGNAAYAAPELFWARVYDGPPVDAWSLGVLLYRMVAGVVPFKGKDRRETGLKILGGQYEVPAHFSPGLRLLLTRLLAQDPGARSTVGGVMTDPWVTVGQEEDRGPQSEPPPRGDDLDPWVTQEMAKLGIPADRIEHALASHTFGDIMGTYLILSTRKPQVRWRTIKVRPFRSPGPGSRSPSPPQEARAQSSGLQQAEPPPRDREAAQKAQESAGPAASPEPTTATPGPSPPPAAATPAPSPPSTTAGPGPESAIAAPGPGPVSAIATPGPSPRSATATRGPSPQSLFAAPGPSLQSLMATPGPSPKPPTTSPRPSRKTTTAKPKTGPKWRKVAPRHSPKARNPTPRPSPKTRTATPSPSPSPSPRPQRRTATPPPVQEPELSTASPPPNPESTPSPAPQGGPADSPCSPGASGSSSGGGTGAAEGAGQGRRGVARRCLDFLKKLCLGPCRKGRGKRNRVAPL